MISFAEKKTSWCQPISSDSFGGEPSRYDEKYERLLNEIAKLESVHGAPCEWEEVFTCADYLLSHKTKDMTVLGALGIASFKRARFQGMAAVLEAYFWLVENYSDELFPKPQRQRGRAGAYTWFTEHLIKELEPLEQGELKPNEHEDIKRCLNAFESLDKLLRDPLGTLHPRIGPITRLLTNFIERTQPPAIPEPPVPAQPVDAVNLSADASTVEAASEPIMPQASLIEEPESHMVETSSEIATSSLISQTNVSSPVITHEDNVELSQSTSAKSFLPTVIENREQALAVLEIVTAALRQTSIYFLEQEAQSSLGYHLAHVASFLGMVPDGERTLRAPSPRRIAAIQEAVQDHDWNQVLQAVPELLKESDMSLNVECGIARALEGVGNEKALATMNGQAYGLYLQLGKFMEVSPETIAWLDSLPPSSQSDGNIQSEIEHRLTQPEEKIGDPSPATFFIQDLVAKAEKQTSSDGLEAGCKIIQDVVRNTGDKKLKFRLRLALASLCIREQAIDLARPLLHDLYQELNEPIRLWEPQLLAEVVTALLNVNRQIQNQRGETSDPELNKECAELMDLLSRIDVAAAYRLRNQS